jgi:diguanylate cyclase (GGDEF)-like protein
MFRTTYSVLDRHKGVSLGSGAKAGSASLGDEVSRIGLVSIASAERVILAVEVDFPSQLRERLEKAGFTLSFARCMEDAEQLTNDRIPAAFLLTPSLGPDPYGVVRSLRSQERLAFVQVFMFAINRRSFRMREAIAAGVDDIFDLLDVSHSEMEETADRIAGRIARSQSLAQLALLDPLTQLYNRRFMNERLPAEVAHAGRTGTRFAMAFIDLDKFKRLNDVFGHAAGDRALVAFGQVLRSGLRLYDVTCRFGGDEFVVLFPDSDGEGAKVALDKLRSERAWVLSDLPAVTFSAGIAQFPDDGHSWAQLFDVADRNLRSAKKGGRGRTVGAARARVGAV